MTTELRVIRGGKDPKVKKDFETLFMDHAPRPAEKVCFQCFEYSDSCDATNICQPCRQQYKIC